MSSFYQMASLIRRDMDQTVINRIYAQREPLQGLHSQELNIVRFTKHKPLHAVPIGEVDFDYANLGKTS